MRFNRIISIILVAALLLVFPACSNLAQQQGANGEYKAYLYATTDDIAILTEGATVYTRNTNSPTTPSETSKSITVNGNEYNMTYSGSFDQIFYGSYDYSTADRNISCLYDSDTSQLLRISLRNFDMSRFADMGLEECELWIKQFVGQFYQEDWDTLQPQYITYFYSSGDGYAGVTAEQGFLTECEEDEVICERKFIYTRYYNSVKTGDDITVNLDMQNNYVLVWFNRHKFDNFSIELDQNAINAAITEFVNSNLNKNYTAEDIDIGAGTLEYSGDNLMYSCSVTVNYLNNSDEGQGKLKVLIDIPDP